MNIETNHSRSQNVSGFDIGSQFRAQVQRQPMATAIEDADIQVSYFELHSRACRLANLLQKAGMERGDRIALLSENRREYVDVYLAAAFLGLIVACQNWRQSESELQHCIDLSGAKAIFFSQRYALVARNASSGIAFQMAFGSSYEAALRQSDSAPPRCRALPEDGFVILYTSGTTGYPKGALISHRALIARTLTSRIDGSLFPEFGYICWSPLFHMASTDSVIGMLISGGKIIVTDGFDAGMLVTTMAREPLGVLTLMPGMLDAVVAELDRTGAKPKGIQAVGSLVDLVPPTKIAQITTLLGAPYRNTFGSTETGLAPASKGRIPIGVIPTSFSKVQSSYCDIRLVDDDDRDVSDGSPGEVLVKSPTLFSGYWEAPEANAEAFRGGWYHMGDILARNPNGTLDFVDRKKYLIKSGGENIYPAEIERVLLAHPGIAEAAVVRKADSKWGEVPVAFIVTRGQQMSSSDVVELCRGHLAGYKVPKEVRFVSSNDIPRNLTGKILRHELETKISSSNDLR